MDTNFELGSLVKYKDHIWEVNQLLDNHPKFVLIKRIVDHNNPFGFMIEVVPASMLEKLDQS